MGVEFDDAAYGRLKIELDKKIREDITKVVIMVDQAIVLATPVDTGRARANWLPSLDSASTEVKEQTYDKGGYNSIAAATKIAEQAKVGQTIFIANNLPYIGALNDGHSKQAPAGFVQKAVQAAKSALE